MIPAIIGAALGVGQRLVPEILKFMDRKADRSHELAMIDKNLAADKQRAELNIRAIEAQDAAAVNAGELQALIAGVQAQAAPTGIRWVDALSASVRPVLTYLWCGVFYACAKIALIWVLLAAGKPVQAAILAVWGATEEAIASSMISFWFVDRAIRKGGGVGPAH